MNLLNSRLGGWCEISVTQNNFHTDAFFLKRSLCYEIFGLYSGVSSNKEHQSHHSHWWSSGWKHLRAARLEKEIQSTPFSNKTKWDQKRNDNRLFLSLQLCRVNARLCQVKSASSIHQTFYGSWLILVLRLFSLSLSCPCMAHVAFHLS